MGGRRAVAHVADIGRGVEERSVEDVSRVRRYPSGSVCENFRIADCRSNSRHSSIAFELYD